MPGRTPVNANNCDRIAALIDGPVGVAAIRRGDDGGVVRRLLRGCAEGCDEGYAGSSQEYWNDRRIS